MILPFAGRWFRGHACSAAVPAAVWRASPLAAPRARRPCDNRQDTGATISATAVIVTRSQVRRNSVASVAIKEPRQSLAAREVVGTGHHGDGTLCPHDCGVRPIHMRVPGEIPYGISRRGRKIVGISDVSSVNKPDGQGTPQADPPIRIPRHLLGAEGASLQIRVVVRQRFEIGNCVTCVTGCVKRITPNIPRPCLA
jgi:hypothetical protein